MKRASERAAKKSKGKALLYSSNNITTKSRKTKKLNGGVLNRGQGATQWFLTAKGIQRRVTRRRNSRLEVHIDIYFHSRKFQPRFV